MLLNADSDCILDSLVCPSCASNNIVYRLTCWRCGGALPYRVDPNGHVRANLLPAPAPWSQAEMDSLMSQAVLFDLTGGKTPSSKRKAAIARAIPIRSAAGGTYAPIAPQRARIEMVKRAAATFSLAFLAVAAVSGPGAPKKMKIAPHKNGAKHKGHASVAASLSRNRAKQAARHSALTLAKSENYSLDAETSKLREEVWARKQDFLTKALTMVLDYEAAHGPIAPAPRGAVAKAGAPYHAYVACMKRALIQEGIL